MEWISSNNQLYHTVTLVGNICTVPLCIGDNKFCKETCGGSLFPLTALHRYCSLIYPIPTNLKTYNNFIYKRTSDDNAF